MKLRLRFVTLLFVLVSPAAAQQRPDSVARTDTIARRVSPGTAFYRSLLVPGWGQLSVGAPKRAAAFITIQGASAFMLTKTMIKLEDAREVEEEREEAARDSLDALMATDTIARKRLSDPVEYQAAIDSTEGVQRVRRLIDSRKQQRQDWVTYLLVSTLASGVDAFVAAHLADFPARVDAEMRRDGGYDLKFTVPTRRRQ